MYNMFSVFFFLLKRRAEKKNSANLTHLNFTTSCIKRCDKLMAFLLFYDVIKFLLITLRLRSNKGCAVSRDGPVQPGAPYLKVCKPYAVKNIYNVHYTLHKQGEFFFFKL